jgi:hypothetical protein
MNKVSSKERERLVPKASSGVALGLVFQGSACAKSTSR